jgi:hypothetical protein
MQSPTPETRFEKARSWQPVGFILLVSTIAILAWWQWSENARIERLRTDARTANQAAPRRDPPVAR